MAAAAVSAASSLVDEKRSLWRVVLTLAFPVLVQQFLVLSVSVSDRVLAGRLQPLSRAEQMQALGDQLLALGHSANALAAGNWAEGVTASASLEAAQQITSKHVAYQAAQTTAIYLSWVIAAYTVLVSVGSTALVARFVGAGDRTSAIRVANQSILLAVAFGILGTTVGLAGLRWFVRVLQLQGEAQDFAAGYLQPLILLLVFQVIESAGIACFIGAGDTRTGFWVLGGVAVVNLPLAWGFFLGMGPLPELRFVGIAWGTAISHTLGGLAVLILLARGRSSLRLSRQDLWPDADLIRRLLRISMPAGLDSLSLVVGHLWFLGIVNGLGNTASSAHGIALTWEALSFLSGAAFGTAGMTLVGQNLGAGQPARAARSGWVAFALGGSTMTLMGVVFYVWAPEMFRAFCPNPEQQDIVAVGVPVLRLEAFAEPALASLIIFAYALRGAGDTRVPMLFSWIGLLGIRIPLAYLLALDHLDLGPLGTWSGGGLGLYGAWMAMVADLLVRGCFFLARFASGRWQRIRV
jgi:putative MATE family efflux protein